MITSSPRTTAPIVAPGRQVDLVDAPADDACTTSPVAVRDGLERLGRAAPQASARATTSPRRTCASSVPMVACAGEIAMSICAALHQLGVGPCG